MLAAKHNFLLLSVATEDLKEGAHIHIYIFVFRDYEYIPPAPLQRLSAVTDVALEYLFSIMSR